MRNIYIDWLRGLSILAVMTTHKVITARLLFFLPENVAKVVSENGAYGVTVFFTVSGFLIATRALQRWGDPQAIEPHEFYILRAARILPLLVVFLTFFVCVFLLGVKSFSPPDHFMVYRAVVAALTFQYNQFFMQDGNSPGLFPMSPLWSLSVEEVFYLAFPLVMLLLKRRPLIVLLFVIIVIQGPVARDRYQFYSVVGSIDAMAFGCLAAMLVDWLGKSAKGTISGALLMITGFCLGFGVMCYAPILDFMTFGPSLVSYGSAIFLVGANFASDSGKWRFPMIGISPKSPLIVLVPVAFFGALSYELYLFHVSYLYLVSSYLVWDSFRYSFMSLVILGTAALAINQFFSEPMNRAIRNYCSGRRAAYPPAQGHLKAAAE